MSSRWEQRLGVWWIAEDHPDLPAVVSCPEGETLTFGQLAGRAHQLVHALRARGIQPGAIVAYALPNGLQTLLWQLATQEGGHPSIALNPALAGAEVREIVDHSGAEVVVAHARFSDRIDQFAGAASVRLQVSVGGDLPGFVPAAELVAGQPTTAPADRRWAAPIAYSSGTTGKPKAIGRPTVVADPSVVADQMKLFGRAFDFEVLGGVHLVSAGMYHGGCQSFYQGALNAGQALAIMGRFDAAEALAAIERHRVTTAYMVPTQFVRLLRLPEEVRSRCDTSSLQVVVHSAAPCPLEVKRQMMQWWGPVIWETYGGMEGAATIAKPHRWLERPGTVGRAVRGMRVRILDDDGNEVPTGAQGHVFMEPDVPTFEYRGDPQLTRSIHRGKAFTIGDIGYLDEEGYLFLCDRAKDMIISGGVNIYPAEVEAVLASHPSVADVAVIGLPDPEWGESVLAVVELVEPEAADDALTAELTAYCRERLAGYKCPRQIRFRDGLPRSEAGKVYKRQLRDEISAGR